MKKAILNFSLALLIILTSVCLAACKDDTKKEASEDITAELIKDTAEEEIEETPKTTTAFLELTPENYELFLTFQSYCENVNVIQTEPELFFYTADIRVNIFTQGNYSFNNVNFFCDWDVYIIDETEWAINSYVFPVSLDYTGYASFVLTIVIV